MKSTAKWKCSAALALSMALAACGGSGGGSGLASTPAPVPTPTPTPTPTPATQAIEILQPPATQELAAVSSNGPESQLRIRYDAGTKSYEVMVPGGPWQGLHASGRYSSDPNHYFSYGTGDSNFFQTVATYRDQSPTNYSYSSLAYWGEGVGAYWDDSRFTAFGVVTPAGAVPVTGSASYSGIIAGDSDVLEHDSLIGADVAATIRGSVYLQFDFGLGSLTGSIHPQLYPFAGPIDLGTLSFTDTVYSSGSTSFSGRFATNLSGPNSFSGLFTGPAAQELIGRWNFPFTYSGDGATHSATGAWIAKQ